MISKYKKHNSLILFAILFLMAISTPVMAEVKVSFLYNLSNFNGVIPYNKANIYVDKEKNEIYVIDLRERDVRIFNENGMEVYRFGDDGNFGTVIDLAVDKDGNVLILSKSASKYTITLCNYRGEPISEVELKNLPQDFSGFSPDRMVYREGRLYLADTGSMRIAVTDANGLFEDGYDIASLLGIEEKKKADIDMVGFSVDREGNMLFTVPVNFNAFRLSPDRKITGFGSPGSSPGKFGIVVGIAADDSGYLYVADTLRCVVMIFDKDLNFQTEFGYRGFRPENLIGPRNLALDAKGRLYVSQLRSRGVSVFKITYN